MKEVNTLEILGDRAGSVCWLDVEDRSRRVKVDVQVSGLDSDCIH